MNSTNSFLYQSNPAYNGGAILSILLVVLISIFPFTINGLWFDDTSICSTFWEVQIRGISLFQFLWETIVSWAKINGRFAPLALIQIYSFHYWIHDVRLYRILHVLLILIHLGIFACLLRKLKYDSKFVFLWLALWVGLIQARDYHDPIASYGFFLQFQGIFFTLGILFLLFWLSKPINKWLFLSSLCATMSLLMYEINLVFYPIFLSLLLIEKKSKDMIIRAVIFYSLPLFTYAILTFLIRNSADINYSGVKIGNMDLFFQTYGKQFFAAFPGVFYFFKWKEAFPISKIFSAFVYSPIAWVLIVASLYVTFYCLSNINSIKGKCSNRNQKLITISIFIIFIPPAFIAISQKYQIELTWGTGYLPVYYSYFGVSLVLAFIFSIFVKRFQNFRIPITMVVAILITSNFLINRNVIEKMDKTFVEPQTSLEKSLKNGLFDSIQDEDHLIIDGPIYQFMNRGFFYRYTGKKLFVENNFTIKNEFIASNQYTLTRELIPPYSWKLIAPMDPRIVFDEGWSFSEGTHRWSVSKRAVINLKNNCNSKIIVKVVFDLNTLKSRNVYFKINGIQLERLSTFLNGTPIRFEISPVCLLPGENKLVIETDIPPESPGKEDSRKLSFLISNYSIDELIIK